LYGVRAPMFPAVSQPSNHRSQTSVAENLRRRQLAYIDAMTVHTGKTRTEIAREAGVSPSTISKFENDVDNISQLGNLTMEKISTVTGVPFATWRADAPPQLAEAEATFLDDLPRDDYLKRLITALRAGGNAIDPWVLRSRALEVIGYMPGDVLLVDLNAEAKDGDVVCAQSYDRLGRAETIFRVFQKPFLTAHSMERPGFRPLFVDDDRVQIRGVVVSMLRPRQGGYQH
jgi:transcriptional regulator with XRE-family HTH domain